MESKKKKKVTNEIGPQTEKKLMATKAEREMEIKKEFGINIHILLYVKQITDKDLLYNIGNYTQYHVIT